LLPGRCRIFATVLEQKQSALLNDARALQISSFSLVAPLAVGFALSGCTAGQTPVASSEAPPPSAGVSIGQRDLTPQPCQPSPIWQSGRPAHCPFRGLLGVHSRYGLHTRAATVYRGSLSEGFSHFVTSIAAPVASGWSGRRVGLAPTGKRRLSTAHAISRLMRCNNVGVVSRLREGRHSAHRATLWPPSDRACRSLREPAVDRSEKLAGLLPLALIAPEPRQLTGTTVELDASHRGLRTCHPVSSASKRVWRHTMLLVNLPRSATM
jgi:hypothetical protein